MLYQLSHFRSKDHDHRRDDGAESQIRTGDTAIFSRVLYQLSYLAPQVEDISEPSTGTVVGRCAVFAKFPASLAGFRPETRVCSVIRGCVPCGFGW